MNRRNFLTSILAAGIAPAIVRAESLMVLPRKIILPRSNVIAFGDIEYDGFFTPEYHALHMFSDGTMQRGLPEDCRVIRPNTGLYCIDWQGDNKDIVSVLVTPTFNNKS